MSVVLLHRPKDPINIGTAVRACRNMGVDELRIVRGDELDRDRIGISAPGSERWIAERMHWFDSWEDSIAGLGRLYALTARERAEGPGPVAVEQAAQRAVTAPSDRPACFVFGQEDHGLPNEIVDRCDGVVHLPTSDEYRSINLGQAVLLVGYELLRARRGEPAGGVAAPTSDALSSEATDRAPAIGAAEFERFMGQVERALDVVGFFKAESREHILRALRQPLRRARLSRREFQTYWAAFAVVEKFVQRLRGPGEAVGPTSDPTSD